MILLLFGHSPNGSVSLLRTLNFEKVSHAQILSEVDEFCSLLIQRKLQADHILVPSWVIPTYHRGYGLLDMKDGLGLTNVLNQMNIRLAENLREQHNIFILNTDGSSFQVKTLLILKCGI